MRSILRRLGACLLICAMCLGASPKVHRVGKTVRPIALVLNGTRLPVNPPPVFHKYQLLVPVRRILSALGLSFQKSGRYVRTYAGAKMIQLLIGSRIAQVDNEPIMLEAPPVEIKNTLYAPLRFFTEALGAQAVFNRQTNSVEIISTLVGRSGTGIVNNVDGEMEVLGTVTSLDLTTDPPTIALTYDDESVRTLPISSDVAVIVQDVVAGTSNAGALPQIRPGDYVHAYLNKEGAIKRLVDAYGSRSGTVAAAASGQIVLDDGQVISPARQTQISLNGSPATIDQIAVGDEVMVRYNIDSSQPLEILATRTASGASQFVQSGVSISKIDFTPHHPLRAGMALDVTLYGTPGGTASFDIGPYVHAITMTQQQPGIYTGSYVVPRGVNLANAPILGHLQVGQVQAAQAVSRDTVSIATQPPAVVDVAPDSGAVVNNTRPSIYATFVSGTVPVNSSSAEIVVNGHDVTASCIRTDRFIQYTPGIDYGHGPMHVTVRVSDTAGNAISKSWTFFIGGSP